MLSWRDYYVAQARDQELKRAVAQDRLVQEALRALPKRPKAGERLVAWIGGRLVWLGYHLQRAVASERGRAFAPVKAVDRAP